jgi:hypothetical protein
MPSFLLFVLLAIVLLVVVYGLLRYWETLVSMSPDEEEYEQRVADLNERQANRLSDEQLTRPISDDDAWQTMLRRGRRRRPSYGSARERVRQLRERRQRR